MNNTIRSDRAQREGERPIQSVGEALHDADDLIAAEKPEDARTTLSNFLEDQDHPGAWLKLAKVYRLLNETLVARSILRNVVLKVREPHIMDIIAAKIPFSKMIVLNELQVIYISIPKCGSSSMKDAILHVHNRELRGETSHFHVKEFEKILPFSDLDNSYSTFTKFAVVRNPRDRLRSYFSKNITEARSLVKEAHGKDSYYGLNTLPSYSDILEKFTRYRNVFDDFRHHTDSIVGYLGIDKSRYTHIFDIAETPSAIEKLKVEGSSMPVIHNMRSDSNVIQSQAIDAERESNLIASFYRKENEIYY